MRKQVVVGILFILGLWGCYSERITSRRMTSRTVKYDRATTLYRDRKFRSGYIQIDKVTNSSGYCADVIAEKYVNNRIVYRLYYGCSIYKTRKELFSYCSQGALMGSRLFDGTEKTGINYKTQLSELDKFVLHKIDSFIQMESEELEGIKLCKKDIGGFERVKYDSSMNRQNQLR
ncbi:MAG TPA: hypothetical protein VIU12_32675 [Chryseolinea sp.]